MMDYRLNSNGRIDFTTEISQRRYKQNDSQGKEVGYRLLVWLLENQPEIFKKYFGDFTTITFEIIEKKGYGDIIIIVDGIKYDCEIECRSEKDFLGNFYQTGVYKQGINVPLKHNLENANGIFISLNRAEVEECLSNKNDLYILPKAFIIIPTEIIAASNKNKAPLKNGEIDPKNPDDKYGVPHRKSQKYGYDGKKFTVYN